MIVLPKYTDMYCNKPIVFPVTLKGEFRFSLKDLMGREVYDSGWEDNIILTQGLDYLGGPLGPMYYCNLGDDNTAEDISQTGCISWLGSADSALQDDYGNNGIGDGYSKWSTTYSRFNPTVATGTIREVTVSRVDDNVESYNRHVLAVPIVKTVDNVLDVWWKGTAYPPLGDVNGTVTLDGLVYDTQLRGCLIDEAAPKALIGTNWFMTLSTANSTVYEEPSVLGANTGIPTGAQAGVQGSTIVSASYTPGSYYHDASWDWALNNGNSVGALGIRCHTFRFSNFAGQCRYVRQGGGGETIPKTETKTLRLDYRQAWARH